LQYFFLNFISSTFKSTFEKGPKGLALRSQTLRKSTTRLW